MSLPTTRILLRGKHNNRPNRILEEQREDVRDYIKSFPPEASHWGA